MSGESRASEGHPECRSGGEFSGRDKQSRGLRAGLWTENLGLAKEFIGATFEGRHNCHNAVTLPDPTVDFVYRAENVVVIAEDRAAEFEYGDGLFVHNTPPAAAEVSAESDAA